MPHVIREYDREFASFKTLVDTYLMEVPDCPILDGFISHNMDKDNKPSNSIIDWNENLNCVNCIPIVLNTKAGFVA